MTLQDHFLENVQMARLWDPEKNGDMKPADLSLGSRRFAWWRCERGHSWQAQVYSVKAGCSCPYCSGRNAIPGETDLVTLHPGVMEQWDGAKNAGVDPREMLPSSHEKAWWLCEKGHSWQAMIFARTRENSSGCPYCTGRQVLAGFNDLATLKPKVAEEWHPTLNGKLRPEDVTLGSNKKVWWKCAEGHVWQSVVYSRTRKKSAGCPVCAGKAKQKREQLRQAQRKAIPRTAENRPRV